MKKFLSLILAALLLMVAVPVCVAADPQDLPYVTSSDVGFIDYSGSNDASGSSASSAKKSFGTARSTGVMGLLGDGGTMVVSGKGYLGQSYTLPKTKTPLLITSVYAGTDYRNASPASNPSCAFKMASNASFTIESDVIIDNIILFQEHVAPTSFVVTSGATLVIGKNVETMSKTGTKIQIVVNSGGRLVLSGSGDFDIVSKGGELVEGYSYDYLKAAQTDAPKEDLSSYTNVPPATAFISYNSGSNTNSGLSDSAPKKQLLHISEDGALSVVAGGGTLVACGRLYVGGDYTIPKLGSELLITGAYNGTSYVNAEPENNPSSGMIKLLSERTLTIEGDVRLDDIILFQENGQNVIKVANGGKLTIGDGVILMSKQLYNMRLEVEKGGTIVFESADHGFDSISGDGMVIMPETEEITSETRVVITIDAPTMYVNDAPVSLDAPAMIRNNRTLLPVRAIANALGVANEGIAWDAATRTATLKNETTTIVITIDAPTMTVNGETVALDSPAIIEKNRTFLPVRAIANALGVANEGIAWDAATRTATLVK